MKVLRILVIAFILTFVSGLYIFRPMSFDSVPIYFGFPFPWLKGIISRWWEFQFRWSFLGHYFIIDFLIYGLIAIIATSIYDKKSEKIAKPRVYRTIFWLSAVGLVVCCWVFIFWNFTVSLPFSYHFLRPLVDVYQEVESSLRFSIGVMTIIFTWFLIKYLKQVSTPLATSSD